MQFEKTSWLGHKIMDWKGLYWLQADPLGLSVQVKNCTLNKAVVDVHERNRQIKNYLEDKMNRNCWNLEEGSRESIIPIGNRKTKKLLAQDSRNWKKVLMTSRDRRW